VTAKATEIKLKTRDQALVIVGTLFNKEYPETLWDHLPENRKSELEPWINHLLDMPGKRRVKYILERLKSFLDEAYLERIDEIHPTWISDYLSREPPALAGLVLKTLPPAYLRKVVKELPSDIGSTIRWEVKGVKPRAFLRELLLTILVRKFELINRMSGIGDDPFEMLFFLDAGELGILIEEIGLSELAMACQKLPEKDFSYICSKLSENIRPKIEVKMELYESISKERIVRARRCFLHMKDENLYEKGQLITFTGLHLLSQSIRGITGRRVPFLIYKLPRKNGVLLQKMLEQDAGKISQAEIDETRREIVEKIVYLSEIDRIRSLWKHYWRG
jgi:flagellar motor switch protein FliG